MNEEAPDNEEDLVSKSELKRQMTALQTLGEELIKFDANSLASLNISDSLNEAISTAKRIKKREGLRRQLQFIGKLMRKESEESLESIQKLLDKRNKASNYHIQIEKKSEHWRELMLSGGDNSVQDFINEHPDADRQWLRQTIRIAKREISANNPPASSRKLFRYIREQIENSP